METQETQLPAEPVALTDDEVLQYSQSVRMQLSNALTRDGRSIPTDDETCRLLLTTLKDMDMQSLGNKRLGVASDVADSDRVAANALKSISRNFGNSDPFTSDALGGSGANIDPTLIATAVLVPGEKSIGTSNESYETFMAAVDG